MSEINKLDEFLKCYVWHRTESRRDCMQSRKVILFDRCTGVTFTAVEERRGILKHLVQEENIGIWGGFKSGGMPKISGFSKPDNPCSVGSKYL